MMGRLTFKTIGLVILVTFLWALCFPLIETGHRAASPLLFAAIRSFIAGALLVVPLLVLRGKELLNFTLWRDSIFVGLSYTALGFGGMFLADGRVGPGLATVLTESKVILAAVLAYFILSERVSRSTLAGLCIGFLGILIIASPGFLGGSSNDLWGVGYLLMGASGIAFGNVFIRKFSPRNNVLALTAIQFLLGSLVLFVASFLFEESPIISWHREFNWSLAALSIGTAASESIWIYLLRQVELTTLNTFSFLTPAFGLGIGIGFFGERLGATDILGVLTIGVGLFFTIRHSVTVPIRGRR